MLAWENSSTALHMDLSGSAQAYPRSVKHMTEATVKRGDIFYADLSPVVGSEQGGTRPVLIVQNDTGNRHSPTVIAAAITVTENVRIFMFFSCFIILGYGFLL